MAKPTTQTLTPAQVELLDQKIAERHDALEAQLQMQDQIAALQAQLAAAVLYGQAISLRTQKGVTLCVTDGGPDATEQPVTWQSRTGNGPVVRRRARAGLALRIAPAYTADARRAAG